MKKQSRLKSICNGDNSVFDQNVFLMEYPEFVQVSPCAIIRTGNREDDIVSDTAFGDLREHAVFLRTAHRLALRFNIGKQYQLNGMKNASNSAITTSKSASNSSLSESSELNAFVRSDNPLWADFGRTSYGLEYLSLLEETLPESQVVYSRGVDDVYR